ncbi:MAG: class F sortase [Propionibacteriaceae bacterium]|jgi:hypothetical protein|nr:class F sortase [Propionibacteriaceae bacterium]
MAVKARRALPAKKDRRGWIFIALALLCLVGAGYFGWQYWSQTAGALETMEVGRYVVPDDDMLPGEAERQSALEDSKVRFVVPSVGLDVPLGSINAVDGRMNPPGFKSAYSVRNMGVPPERAEEGTLYVVAHSLRTEGATAGQNNHLAPGSYLIDVPNQRAAVAVGDEILVDAHRYWVTGSRTVLKTALRKETDIWTSTPGRLVFITCLQNGKGTPSTMNLIILAELAQ